MIALYDIAIATTDGEPPVISGLSLSVDEGGWHEIVGPSGSGKTALFEVMTLRRRPTAGKLIVAGRNVDRLKEGGLAEVRRQIGSCEQQPTLLSRRTAVENTVLPMVVRGETEQAVEAAEEVLGFLGVMPQRDLAVDALSEQDQILVGVAMATVGAPPLIVIDGVHESLEPAVRGVVLSWLEQLRDDGSTVVILGRRPMNRRSNPVLWRLREGSLERTGEVDRC